MDPSLKAMYLEKCHRLADEELRRKHKVAFSISKQAAERGDRQALFDLGIAYATGNGAPLNEEEAVKYFRLAAERKLVDAMYELGVSYAKGRGVNKDDALAIEWCACD